MTRAAPAWGGPRRILSSGADYSWRPAVPAGAATGGLRRVLFADFLSAVLQLGGFAQQRLLTRGIAFEVGLHAEQQVLVDERFHVLGVQHQRLVDRFDAELHVLDLLAVAQAEVAVRLLPVVGRHRVEGFRIVGFAVGACLQRLHALVELALPIVVGGQSRIDGRVIGLHFPSLDERRLSVFIVAAVFVNPREREIVDRFAWVHLNELLDHRLRLRRVVQLIGPVRVRQVLERQPFEFRALLPFCRQPVVRNRLLEQGVVLRFAPPGRPVLVVVAVSQVEVRLGLGRVGRDRRFIGLDRATVILLLVSRVTVLERHPGLDHLHLAAPGGRQAQPRDERQHDRL